MKNFYQVITLTMAMLSLIACNSAYITADGSVLDYIEDDRGASIQGCFPLKDKFTGKTYYHTISKSDANGFWENNNLPKGTINFVCKDGKAYLPKDCQGNSLNRQQIVAYWDKYQLPKGLVNFDCSTGTPKVPANELKFWQDLERQTPTCKGGKPCV